MPLTLRQLDILAQARETGRVVVEELAMTFGVTVQTIRRDLNDLCEDEYLQRTHGGAALPSGIVNIAYEDRRRVNAYAKEAIGRKAVEMLVPGMSLFLNIGTTVEAVARSLRAVPNLMVVTNNLHVAQILSAHPGAEVIVTGGKLRPVDGALVGDVAVQSLRRFKLDLAIIGTSALDHDGCLLDFDPDEVQISQAILQCSRQVMLVADHGKLDRHAPVCVTDLGRMTYWVTDRQPDADLCTLCEDLAVQISVSEPPR